MNKIAWTKISFGELLHDIENNIKHVNALHKRIKLVIMQFTPECINIVSS